MPTSSSSHSSVFISVEGMEGAGKSTALTAISECLQQHGVMHLLTREPGGSALGESIRDLLLNDTPHTPPIHPLTELLLLFAARTQHWHQRIMPALSEGKWVISDRFIDASFAYQGGGRALPPPPIDTLSARTTRQ